MARYNTIGTTYTLTRREEPRYMERILRRLADAKSVVNVGAGTGNYEPRDREVISVEPSATMIAQRHSGAGMVIQGVAEALPLPDATVDAAMAVFTDHHWTDPARGLEEMLRVARRRVVALTWDPAFHGSFWLVRDYLQDLQGLPDQRRRRGPSFIEAARSRYALREEIIPVPWDVIDGTFQAFWRRPEAYLDPAVRANISIFRSLDAAALQGVLDRLYQDLTSGAWLARNSELLERHELDVGNRLITIERSPGGRWPQGEAP